MLAVLLPQSGHNIQALHPCWLQTGALVAVLKEARKRSLLPQLHDSVPSGTQDHTLGIPGGTAEVRVPAEQLLAAAVHREEAVRLDTLTLACHSPRSAAMPGGASACCPAHGLETSCLGTNMSWAGFWLHTAHPHMHVEACGVGRGLGLGSSLGDLAACLDHGGHRAA